MTVQPDMKSRRYVVHEVAACLVLALAIWLASGTLSPYGDQKGSIVVEPCHYLVNIDHWHHLAGFYLLAGADESFWLGSVVLRRILYPIVAYPFVRALGFLAGGLLCNFVITAAAMLAFGRFVRKRFGVRGAIAVLWLLATYPGITYWAGLPYSYAAIVPASLLAAMLLYRLDGAEKAREVFMVALLLGIVLLAYDLFAFFVPAAILILLRRRKPLWAVLATVVAMSPMLVVDTMLTLVGVMPLNSNTVSYVNVVNAYLHPGPIGLWLPYLERLPFVLVANFFDSNFFFLPLLAVLAVVLCRRCIGRVEGAILLAVLAVFLFNNAAPPYYGWQVRGLWIARVYQAVFVALLLCVARAFAAEARPAVLRAATWVTVIANAAIAFGPVMMNPMAFYFDYRFYQHVSPAVYAETLQLYGRRPLGICRPTHEGDDRPAPPPSIMRPPFAFRPLPVPREPQ